MKRMTNMYTCTCLESELDEGLERPLEVEALGLAAVVLERQHVAREGQLHQTRQERERGGQRQEGRGRD